MMRVIERLGVSLRWWVEDAPPGRRWRRPVRHRRDACPSWFWEGRGEAWARLGAAGGRAFGPLSERAGSRSALSLRQQRCGPV